MHKKNELTLFTEGRSRSSVELLSPCCCSFHKAFPANKTRTRHAYYWSTRGLDVKHKSDNIDEIYVFRDGKSIFLLTSIQINLQWFLRLATVPRSWSWALPLLSVLQLLLHEFLLELEAKLKGWGQTWLGNLAGFLCYHFPPLNSTPTPPFIG
jgi:hypothetical protein